MFPAMNRVEQFAVELMLLDSQPLFSRLTEIGNMVNAGDLTLNEYSEICRRVSQHLDSQYNALHLKNPPGKESFE